ncbi:hypothetical protein BH20ACT3_BH20ACT3_05210 [soil metagenome]
MLRPPIESAQYTSSDFAALARTHHVVLSIGPKGQCLLGAARFGLVGPVSWGFVG